MSALDVALARRAIRAFPRHFLAERGRVNRLRLEWMRCVRHLGSSWKALPVDKSRLVREVAQ